MEEAEFQKRIFAFFLDYVLIVVYGLVVIGGAALLFQGFFVSLFSHSPLVAQATGFLLITLPVSLYFCLMEASYHQATWGKRKLKLFVTDRNGDRIGLLRSLGRNGLKFLPWEVAHFFIWHTVLPSTLPEKVTLTGLTAVNIIVLVYVVFPFFQKRSRNLYDLAAGTIVCKKG